MIDLSQLGSLSNLAEQMQDAYSKGLGAMDQAGQQVTQEMSPDHQINIVINLSAKVDGHDYSVKAEIVFQIELDPVIEASSSPMGDLSSLLDGLNVDLGDDKEAVMDQLGQPRAIGVIKKINKEEVVVSNSDGKASAKLNKKATLLATIKDEKILFNFEGVLSYPDQPGLLISIPSMEKMQRHIAVDLDKIGQEIKYSCTENDKDNLKVSGSLQIKKIYIFIWTDFIEAHLATYFLVQDHPLLL